MSAEICRAKDEDADILTEIAHSAKRYWGYPERWIRMWKEALTITPVFISNNEVYCARIDGEMVGFYALAMLDNKASLEHLWVTPDRIGTGLGKVLFNHAIGTARKLGATTIEIESDPNAEGFYQRMGARRTGQVSSDLDGQPRVLPVLVLDVND